MTNETRSLDLAKLRLAVGKHNPDDGEMCVMEAVAYIAGEDWTDSPQCVSPAIAQFLRSWNDGSTDEQRQELKRYIGRPLLTSRGTEAQELERSWMAFNWLVGVQAVAWLRLAGLDDHADALAGLEWLGPDTIKAATPVIRAARDAARAAAGAAAWDAAGAAARAALQPTVIKLRDSAHDLVDRMLAVTEAAS